MELNLLEEYLLIALDDDKGKFVNDSTHLHYGFAGALLLELAIREKIEISSDKVFLKDSSLQKEVAINKAIELLQEEGSIGVKSLIGKLAKKASEYKNDTLQRLINKGVLDKKEEKILWIIPNDKYPAQNMDPENKIRQRLNDVMLRGAKSEPRDVMLLSLINVSNLTKEAFRDADDYKEIKKKIESLTSDIKISQVINKSIREIQAAIMVAIMASTVITTTTAINS